MKKRKDGFYQVSKVIDGKRKYFYGKTRAAAEKKRNEYVQRSESHTFRDVAEDWWDHHEPTLAYNTTKGYVPALKRAIAEFGDMEIADITPPMIAQYIRSFASHYGRSDKVVRTQLMIINLIFKHGINFYGINMNNPARDIAVPNNLKKTKISAPDAEDIKRIAASVDVPFGLFPFMAMYTGMRKGELLCLDWTDVDVENRRITISKSVYHDNNVPHIKTPKTAAGVRSVPILDALLPYMTGRKGLIFPNEYGTLMSETQYQRQWELYVKATGVKCTAHQLRHLYATILYENEIAPRDAMLLLGHKNIQTTLDVYTEIRQQRISEIERKMYGIKIQ